jgi:hypothetical protein
MSRLGRLFGELKKTTGDAALGVTVEVRRQGATVTSNQSSSSSPHAYTVDDPGGILAGDSVRVGTGLTSYSVTAIGVNSVTLAFGGTLSLLAGDRLTPTNAKPTLYSDRQGVNTTANPTATTGPFGEYEVYLDGGEYDVLASGGGYGTRLFRDVYVSSPRMVMNVFDSASGAKAFIFAVKTALVDTDAKMISIQNPDGNEVGFVDYAGNVFIDGGINTAQLANGAVTTVKLADGAVTTIKITDANVTTAKLAANAVHPAPDKTLAGSSDVSVTTSEVVRATKSYTSATGNVGVLVTVNLPYIVTASGTGKVEVRLYIGGSLKATAVFAVSGQTCIGTVSFTWFEPTVAVSAVTFEVREILTTFNGGTTATYKYAGASGYQGYMTLQEMKR